LLRKDGHPRRDIGTESTGITEQGLVIGHQGGGAGNSENK